MIIEDDINVGMQTQVNKEYIQDYCSKLYLQKGIRGVSDIE